MARAKTTTEMGKEHEEFVARLYEWDAASVSKSSGASFHDPADITTCNRVIECESTENKSYSLKLSFWEEAVSKTFNGKQPALAIRFRDPHTGKHTDLLVTSLHDDTENMEALEAFRKDALVVG